MASLRARDGLAADDEVDRVEAQPESGLGGEEDAEASFSRRALSVRDRGHWFQIPPGETDSAVRLVASDTEPPFRMACKANLPQCYAGSVVSATETADEALPERRRRSDAERNRQRVLDAAVEVFAEPGIDAQIPDVARRAGVGIATVYRNFPSKRALLSRSWSGASPTSRTSCGTR